MLVLITDSVRFPDIPARLAAIARSLPAGSFEVQVREKHMDGGALLAYVRAVMASCDAPVWVNDRVDVALAAGAYGVHLPERGIPKADARTIAPTLKIGASVHQQGGGFGLDSMQLGPIWETPGKGPPLGPGILSFARGARLIAVGGIDTPARAAEAVAAGADGVAMIRAAWTMDLRPFDDAIATAHAAFSAR
ncbi:MAG: thiamine phosphate synthase [Deltaproteobacteria bacterium]|nr:thiamine phosphate synthase [Deltaproteobacteria bacterium]